jgi:hypothetical protein
MNITEKSDEEIFAIANPMWLDLVRHSNQGDYGEFVKHFSGSLMLAFNEVEAGRQFATSELTRNLSEEFDTLGTIRRGEYVTVVFRQRSVKRPGEWMGRLVLGYEDDEVKIFGATIF